MNASSLETQIAQEEQKNAKKSILITAAVFIIAALFLLVWNALLSPVVPIEEELYVTTGRIDFGNWTEGSSNVNNFQDPSPNPSDNPKSQTTPMETQPREAVSQPTQVIGSENANTPNEITKTNSETVNDNPSKTPTNTQNPTKTPTTPTKESQFEMSEDEDGGSNHGNGDQTGNRGRDDTRVLDPKGAYSWGDGGDGNLNGRTPISLPQPKYETQADAKLTFEITIAPNGSVKYVKAPMTTYNELADAGKEALYKWKFNDIGQSGQDQKIKVTIKFFRK